jgi:hypothetical protein
MHYGNTVLNCIFCEGYALIKILPWSIFFSLLINHVVESICAYMYAVLPHHIQIQSYFLKNVVSVQILWRDFCLLFIKGLYGRACRCRHPYCVATIVFPIEILLWLKCYKGTFSFQCSSGDHRHGVHMTGYLYHVATLHWTLIVLCVKIVSGKILFRWVFISVLINEFHGGVHRIEYLCHVATLHSTLITFLTDVSYFKFCQEEFCSSQNMHTGVNWHEYPFHFATSLFLLKLCISQNKSRGILCLFIKEMHEEARRCEINNVDILYSTTVTWKCHVKLYSEK